ncbi:MAG: DUF3455 domain-containing protein [Oculatellaceae cyanobacterium Prado106]|jgi:hypothetical protein|nr:DUF3455 domain-containing protein [Oculatellaceae cyanobacterium Prado106]
MRSISITASITALTATTLSVVGSIATLTALAQTAPTVSPTIPESLKVPAEQQLLMKVYAEGDQIYTCQAKADSPNTYEWTLKAPEAELYDEQGQQIGTHYVGPSWELNDGSTVVGQLKTRVDAPDTNDIPWLLLEAKSHEGEGLFSRVNWVQRINTSGGKAPATGCDRNHQNAEVRVGYSSDYYFYGTAMAQPRMGY